MTLSRQVKECLTILIWICWIKVNKYILFFYCCLIFCNFKAGKIESISRNIRVKLPEKDEDEISNDEMEDDVYFF